MEDSVVRSWLAAGAVWAIDIPTNRQIAEVHWQSSSANLTLFYYPLMDNDDEQLVTALDDLLEHNPDCLEIVVCGFRDAEAERQHFAQRKFAFEKCEGGCSQYKRT